MFLLPRPRSPTGRRSLKFETQATFSIQQFKLHLHVHKDPPSWVSIRARSPFNLEPGVGRALCFCCRDLGRRRAGVPSGLKPEPRFPHSSSSCTYTYTRPHLRGSPSGPDRPPTSSPAKAGLRVFVAASSVAGRSRSPAFQVQPAVQAAPTHTQRPTFVGLHPGLIAHQP